MNNTLDHHLMVVTDDLDPHVNLLYTLKSVDNIFIYLSYLLGPSSHEHTQTVHNVEGRSKLIFLESLKISPD